MRYYVIINGVNSLTIEGLAIKTLPPISKPAMRNLREEIDGRDGDITTELGYGAYDRPLEIGLFGDYDIDRIISFFNTKGTIIFSDEPDKYYNFEIVDKIDYTKLVKFRTATINIHCQPFKYPVSEEPQVEEYEYVEATGSNVTLDNTSEAIFNKIDLKGNTSQNGTPTPSSPIPVNVVSGDNYINICGKNLIPTSDIISASGTISNGITFTRNSDGSITANGTATSGISIYINADYTELSAGTYTFSDSVPSGGSGNTFFLYADVKHLDGTSWDIKNFSTAETTTSTRTMGEPFIFKTRIVIRNGQTLNNVVFKPMLEKGSTATTYEPYIGASYPINLGVKNLFDKSTANLGKGVSTSNGNLYNESPLFATDYIEVKTGGVYYTTSGYSTSANRVYGAQYDSNKEYVGNIVTDAENKTFYISNANTKYIRLTGFISDVNTYQIEEGSKTNSYTPFGTTPIELCKIGDYQDYIYKDNGSWYLHKEIGKVVLDGSENWIKHGSIASWFYYDGITDGYINNTSANIGKCNYFKQREYNAVVSLVNGEFAYGSPTGETTKRLVMKKTDYTMTADFKNWLSTHNTIVYYVLATPTNTLIEDTTLIEQLEELKNATSYKGQTNISQTNNDLPFILDLSALKAGSDHLVINNAGNIYAMPTMDIEGTGVVDIYLNDVQILEADLSETNNIVIDTESMEAYNPDTNALANRQVTGDYSKIKLEPGENDLRFSGDLSKATVTKYKRWL